MWERGRERRKDREQGIQFQESSSERKRDRQTVRLRGRVMDSHFRSARREEEGESEGPVTHIPAALTGTCSKNAPSDTTDRQTSTRQGSICALGSICFPLGETERRFSLLIRLLSPLLSTQSSVRSCVSPRSSLHAKTTTRDERCPPGLHVWSLLCFHLMSGSHSHPPLLSVCDLQSCIQCTHRIGDK